jgi:hypothetical protein
VVVSFLPVAGADVEMTAADIRCHEVRGQLLTRSSPIVMLRWSWSGRCDLVD